MAALLAGRRRTARRAGLQSELMPAVRTTGLFVVDIGSENSGAFRAEYADLWFSVGIGITSEDVGREQIHVRRASGTGKGLDPKKVERVANVALGVRSLVKHPDALAYTG